MSSKKLCVLFPGIGYTTDKPLLYYAGKLAKSRGYELISIKFKNLPKKDAKNEKTMMEIFEAAMEQAKSQLENVTWQDYEEVLFVGKSIGTIVAAAYGKADRYIYMTPLAATFSFAKDNSGIAFHGNSDPWVETDLVINECDRLNIPLKVYEGANHSLETGNIQKDLEYLQDVIGRLWKEI